MSGPVRDCPRRVAAVLFACLVTIVVADRANAKTEDAALGVPLTMRITMGIEGTGYFATAPGATGNYWQSWRDIPPYPYSPGQWLGLGDYDDNDPGFWTFMAIGPLAQVGTAYGLTIHTPNGQSGTVCTSPPPGYKASFNGNQTNQSDFHGDWLFWVQLFPTATDGRRGKAAEFLTSASITMAVNWQLSLGSLHNGSSAGVITLADTGTRSDWTPLYTPSMLSYETSSDEVNVYRENDIPRQVIANQVAVDIVTLSSTAYELRCYDPDQITSTTYPVTFSGDPFVVYRIEQGATATALKFTREYRNVTDLTSSFPIARRDTMMITRAGTGATVNDFTWTRTAWTSDGSTPVAQTTTASSDLGNGNRSETIVVSPDGTTNGAALSLTRNYTLIDTSDEVVASETVGSTNPRTTSFNYYTDTSGSSPTASLLSDVSFPGSGWIAYDYLAANPTVTTTRSGQIHYEYRPYGNAPAVATHDTTQGTVTHYEYTPNEFNEPIWPSLIEKFVNGTRVAKTTFTYTFDTGYPNGVSVTRTLKTDYTDATDTLLTTVCTYRHDWGASIYRGQPYSETEPDASRKAYAYELGTWDGTTFTPGSGTGSRVTVITGTSDSAAGTLVQQWNAQTIEPTYLVDGKSAAESTIRDRRGLIVRTESLRWKLGQWQLVGWTNLSYDLSANLVQRVASNGTTYTATYDAGRKMSETDENGVTTTYTYDSSGRIATSMRHGAGTIPSVTTRFVYDSADHVVQKIIGDGQSEQIMTANAFDDAGRIVAETPPGFGTTTHSYDVSARTHTVTKPDGATIVETANLDGTPASKTGTGVVPEYYAYAVDSTTGDQSQQTFMGTATSPRWTKLTFDWLSREIKREHPGFQGGDEFIQQSFYDGQMAVGHLWKVTKTGSAPTIYQYNSLGQLFRTGLDVDSSGGLDLGKTDRINETSTYLESFNGSWWLRTDTIIYPEANSATPLLKSIGRTRLTGFTGTVVSEEQSVDVEGVVTDETMAIDRAAQTAVKTQTRTGLTGSAITNYSDGEITTATTYDGLTTSTAYDSLLRANVVTDPRGNPTTTAFVAGSTMPSTMTDATGAQKAFHYDANGRKDWERDAGGHYTRFAYNLRDQLIEQWGDGALPVSFGYDATYGDKVTSSTYRAGSGWEGTTWPSDTGTADTTTWAYDAGSGLVSMKTDALGRSVSQTFCSCGKISSRTNARGITISYGYDLATGELTNVGYSDGTPTLTYTYDRMGHVVSVTDAAGQRTFNYDQTMRWRLDNEMLGGLLGGRVFTHLYEDSSGMPGRLHGFQLGPALGGSSEIDQIYGYTPAGRIETVAAGINGDAEVRTFRYGYLPNSALVQSLSVDGNYPFAVNRSYETTRDLLTSIQTNWSAATETRFDFTYDPMRQRTTSVQSGMVYADYGDAVHRQYQYNARGELTGDLAYRGSTPTDSSLPLPGRQYQYSYENAGNRATGNHTGVSGLAENYAYNALNQLVSKENNSQASNGTTDAANAVTVNNQAASRQGNYYSGEVLPPSNSAPFTFNFTVSITPPGQGTTTENRSIIGYPSPQSYTYDNDGNLTSDQLWDYTWDAENRLTSMTTTSAAVWNGMPNRQITFVYDYLGRRIQKRVVDLGTGGQLLGRRFIYDGWNLVAEYDAPNGTSIGSLIRSYAWGLDIVDSLTTSGGVGALLQINDQASGKLYLPAYDANGNVAALFNDSTGAIAASYEYSPYGEPVRSTSPDPITADQPFRFSTKYFDIETGMVYYGRRYYDPRTGRWLSRDPKEEFAGMNLYRFVSNNPINRWDYLGMDDTLMMAPYIVSATRIDDGYGGGMDDGYSAGDDGSGDYSAGDGSDPGTSSTDNANNNSQDDCSGSSGDSAVQQSNAQSNSQPPPPPAQPQGDAAASSQTPDQTQNGAPVPPQTPFVPTVFYTDDGRPHIISGSGGTEVREAYTITAHGGADHTGVILTDSNTGQSVFFEAGPAATTTSGGLNQLIPGNSPLVARPMAPYSPEAVPSVTTQDVGVDQRPLSDVVKDMQTFDNYLNMSGVPYSGSTIGGYNSNSYTAGAEIHLGFTPPPPPSKDLNGVGAVGRDKPIPDPTCKKN